jgi:hypothetical protein
MLLGMATLAVASACGRFGHGGRSFAAATDLERALDAAGANRAVLEDVLQHYASQGDSLKYAAAAYLIRNMEGHCYATFMLCDSTGDEIDFDVLDYPDYDALLSAWREIEHRRGELDFKRQDLIMDLETIPGSLLIENIDLAFRVWREKPWAKHLSFETFCDYVLPYRGSNEPLESWRPYFLNRYQDLGKRMQDRTDPVEAARLINADLQTWFRFDPRYYHHPTDQGLSEMLENRLGRCEDMTNLTIYAMRANGLAVTSDYTPYWANTGNNHAWNSILNRDGQAMIFMGAEAQPGQYSLSGKAAKVYRKTYAHQRQNLAFQKPGYEKVAPWLSGKNYVDVTPDYEPVATLSIEFTRAVPDSVNFAYLCVFNDGEWGPLDWGRIEGNQVTFRDAGRGIAYLAAFYVDEEIVPAAPPFIVDGAGGVQPLTPDPANRTTMQLLATTKRTQVTSTDGVAEASFEAGTEYGRFYWAEDWVSAGRAVAGGGPLVFADVPIGALYWLVQDDSSKEERIFTYDHGAQVWW